MQSPDYLALGHSTLDLLPDATTRPGGTALYAAVTARRLGLQTAVLTASAELPDDLLATGPVVSLPSDVTSTFANRYTHGIRHQWLHAAARPLDLAELPASWRFAPIVHLGPVLHECSPEMIQAFPGALIGVTPQGWLRGWHDPLPAPIEYTPWRPAADLLRHIGLLVLSSADIAGDHALAEYYAHHCQLVVLTHGAEGATLYIRGVPQHIPPHPATEVDPTGAGDVFTAAMLVRLYETGNPVMAAHFASVVAAAAVAGPGVQHIPSRAEVLRWMP
jgi:hypothetical protein